MGMGTTGKEYESFVADMHVLPRINGRFVYAGLGKIMKDEEGKEIEAKYVSMWGYTQEHVEDAIMEWANEQMDGASQVWVRIMPEIKPGMNDKGIMGFRGYFRLAVLR